MTTEHDFYQDARVRVTSARFMTPGQTIAMSGVTAVGVVKHGMTTFEKLCLLVGIAMLLTFWEWGSKIIFAVLLVAFGIWAFLNPVHALHLTSSSGKQRILASRQKARIFAIADAVEKVIVHRR